MQIVPLEPANSSRLCSGLQFRSQTSPIARERETMMASWLPSFDFSFSLGRNVLVGVSIGLGIGIGIRAGMAASRKMFPVQAQGQNLVVRFTELTNEIRELRCVMVRLEVCFRETATKQVVPLKDQRQSDDDETEEDEYYEMSGEELGNSPRFVFNIFFYEFNILKDLLYYPSIHLIIS